MRYVLCLVICGYCLWACSSEPSWQKTADGVFTYQLFTLGESPRIDFGDSVTLHCVLRQEDRVLFDSYQENKPLKVFIPARMHRNSTEELLTLMGEGDSLIAKAAYQDIRHSMADYDLKPTDELTLIYKVEAVRSKAALDAEKEQRYANEKGFASREAMLEERAYVRQKAKWITDTLKAYQTVFEDQQPTDFWAYIPQKGDTATVQLGQTVSIYYVLMLESSGKVLDNAFARANRLELNVGQDSSIIEGLHQATQQLGKGGQGVFFLPPDLAYGQEGSPPIVPPNAWLLTYVEVVDVK